MRRASAEPANPSRSGGRGPSASRREIERRPKGDESKIVVGERSPTASISSRLALNHETIRSGVSLMNTDHRGKQHHSDTRRQSHIARLRQAPPDRRFRRAYVRPKR
jgi:hypothetical protein